MKFFQQLRQFHSNYVKKYGFLGTFFSAFESPKLFWYGVRHVLNRKLREFKGRTIKSKRRTLPETKTIDLVTAGDLIKVLSKDFGLVRIKDDGLKTFIGVADVSFLSVIISLMQRLSNAEIQIAGEITDPELNDFKRRALFAKSVEILWTGPNLTREIISVEAFFRHETGIWLSNNTANKVLRAIRYDCFTHPSLTYARDILGGQTLELKSESRKIDAVYTWVDHSDPEWADLYTQAIRTKKSETDAEALVRFRNNDELKYSLRSLRQNAPWINKIYIVSNCRMPHWMKRDHNEIVWVDHSELLPDWALPTFNSHAIESVLHKITGLSEHFIYLNDDVFLARPVYKEFFFESNGISKSFLEGYGMVSGEVTTGDADYLNASRNSSKLLHSQFDFVATQLHLHTIFALRRSVLMEIEKQWGDGFTMLRKNKFRTKNDINLVSFLYHHYAINQA
jgi:hypothetical protein